MKKAIIFTNGTYLGQKFYQRYLEKNKTADLICADGGANALYTFDATRIPKRIMGDMDSIDVSVLAYYEKNGAEVVRYPAKKDETDTELAVDYCIENDYTEVVLLGAIGTRVDHTFGNFYLLNKMLQHGIHAKIIDAVNEIFLMTGCREMDLTEGSTISIMSYTDKAEGITLKGFEYPVNNGEMNHLLPGYGISNVVVNSHQVICVKKGTLLVDVVTE